jgi:glycosyltransferase involved in cell wall biosynthesis
MLRDADVVFCEWCLGNAVWYSRNVKARQRLIVRLHLQELGLPYLDQVVWDRVEALIVICPRSRDLMLRRFPFLKGRVHVIYNPIDCDALARPKLPGAEFNLGLMGLCPKRKAPHLAVEILYRLRRMDSRYTLFLKGRNPRAHDWLWSRREERAYYENFLAGLDRAAVAQSVVFDDYGDDVPLWFTKIGFILSTSAFEGSHQSVAEGMASGAIPLIRNWAGAGRLYPPRFVFASVGKAVNLARAFGRPDRYSREGEAVKDYARSMFDRDVVLPQLERVVLGAGRDDRATPAMGVTR